MAYTLDTPLGTLIDNPQIKPILEQHFPGITTNPIVGMLKGITLNMVLAMPPADDLGLTKERAEAMLAEVNKFIPS
jgi:hypothetical protein